VLLNLIRLIAKKQFGKVVTSKLAEEQLKSALKSKSSFLDCMGYTSKLKSLLRKPSLREQWKRATKRSTLKGAFRTLSWKYIKEQYQYLLKQHGALSHRRFGELFTYKTTPAQTSARATEKNILRKLITTNKKQVTDSSSLNSM